MARTLDAMPGSKPGEIVLYTEVTTTCTNECDFCAIQGVNRGGAVDPEVRRRVLDLIVSSPGQKFVVYHHLVGEPLLFPDLDEYVRCLAALPNVELWLSTNGVLLDAARLERLRQAGLRNIWFSLLYAEAEDYRRHTHADHGERARHNLDHVLERSGEFDRIHIVLFSGETAGLEAAIREKPNVTLQVGRKVHPWNIEGRLYERGLFRIWFSAVGKRRVKYLCVSIDGAVTFDWKDHNFRDSPGNIRDLDPLTILRRLDTGIVDTLKRKLYNLLHGAGPLGVSRVRIAGDILRSNLARRVPGILSRTGIRPLYANFWVTTRCSGRCRTCTQWRLEAGDEMDTATAKDVIFRLREAGVRIIYFVGGDVFLRDDIFELIRYAVRIGLRSHLTVNGFTVTPEVARALAGSGIESVHLSLDTLTEDFAQIRGISDAAEKVLRALDLLRNGAPPIRLGITTTIMKRTIPAVRDVVRFALANQLTVFFNLINFTHDFFATEFSCDQYELNGEEKRELADLVAWLKQKRVQHPRLMPRLDHLDWIGKYFDDRHQKKTACFQTLWKICVRPNGDVRPCCSMPIAGNVRSRDVAEVLRAEQYLEPVRKALAKDCPGCSCRYTLNLDVSPMSWLREAGLCAEMAWRKGSAAE
jgi:MoaA/NifB/PqqE/SkfB family radical SAM enzyme